jgi:hypothetical protein
MDTAPGPARTRNRDLDEVRGNSRQRRQARNLHGLTTLYETRDDIQGVSQVADFFADSVRWAV